MRLIYAAKNIMKSNSVLLPFYGDGTRLIICEQAIKKHIYHVSGDTDTGECTWRDTGVKRKWRQKYRRKMKMEAEIQA